MGNGESYETDLFSVSHFLINFKYIRHEEYTY